MSQAPQPPDEPETGPTEASRPRRGRWQVGLPTLCLLMAAIAVWMTYFINRQYNERLAARLAVLRPLARELTIDDPAKIAVVKMQELWFDENRWDLYLPEGEYRLCIATRKIGHDGFPPVTKSKSIGGGRHQLSVEEKPDKAGWRVTATCDGVAALVVEEPKEWDPAVGSMGGGQHAQSTQFAVNERVALFRRQFAHPTANGQFSSNDATDEGILLWIERVDGPTAKP